MNEANDRWLFREERSKSRRVCKSLMRMINRKMPKASLPRFAEGDELLFASRYWGCHIDAELTGVRKSDGKEKTLSFSRNWHSPDIPLHIDPLVVAEDGAIAFSPIADGKFEFAQLAMMLTYAGDDGVRIKSAIENFFYWAANQFDTSALDGYRGEIRVERYKIADRFIYRHEGQECEIWANLDTDEVWGNAPEIGVDGTWGNHRMIKFLSFLVPFALTGVLLWRSAVGKNCMLFPPIDPEIQYAFACAIVAMIVGILLRGWGAKMMALASVSFGAYVLVPWLGEAWDMTSEVTLLSPFVKGDLAEAPVGAVYIASSLVLSLLALAAAPSFAFKAIGGNWGRMIVGIALAFAVSPWPVLVVMMPEVSPMPIKIGVILFALLCFWVIGNCGWTLSKLPERHAGADGVLAKIARISRPSFACFVL